MLQQFDLWDDAPIGLSLPSGMKFHQNIITIEEEKELLDQFTHITFSPFEFQGYKGKRRVASYGWRYDFNQSKLLPAPPIPKFLENLRDKVELMGSQNAGSFDQVLISEYEPGAGIGWHKDRPIFGDVVGISLLSPCIFCLRLEKGKTWERKRFSPPPRSAYLLSGPSRWDWEHSVTPVESLRYSITFRKLLDRPHYL